MAGKLVAGYYRLLKIRPPKDGYIFDTNDSGKRAAIDLTGRMVVPFIYRGLNYLPEPRWWLAKPDPDSIRIFPLDGGPDIYCGPGGLVLVNSLIDRIIITTSALGHEQTARLLDMKGREIATITGPGGNTGFQVATGYDFIPDNPHHSLGAPYNQRYLKVMHGGVTALADLRGRILVDSVWVGGFFDGAMLLGGKDRVALLDTFLHDIIPFSAGYSSLKPLEGTPYYFATKRKDGSRLSLTGSNMF